MPMRITGQRSKKYQQNSQAIVVALTEQLIEKTWELRGEQERNERLKREQKLLAAFCDSIAWLHKKQKDLPEDQPLLLHSIADLEEKEEQLLQLLHNFEPCHGPITSPDYSGSSCSSQCHLDLPHCPASLSSSATIDLDKPVCPADDPLLLWRVVLSQPVDERGATISMDELSEIMVTNKSQLALQLQYLESGICDVPELAWKGMEHPVDVIRSILLRSHVLASSIGLSFGRCPFLMSVLLRNHQTGEVVEAPCPRRHRFALEQIGLTPKQLQRLAADMALYKRLQAPLHAEQQRISLLLCNAMQAAGRSTGGTAVAVAAAEAAAGVDASYKTTQGAHLETLQQLTAQLHKLQAKDTIVRSAFAMSMFNVLLHPFVISTDLFTKCAVDYMEEKQQQQQQQQRMLSAQQGSRRRQASSS